MKTSPHRPRLAAHALAVLLLPLLALLASTGCRQQEPAKSAPGESSKPGATTRFDKPIIVATEAAYPPMEFVDKDGSVTGFDIDLMRAVAQEAGLKVEFRNAAWDAIFGMLANGEVDVIASSVTITEERKKTMQFTEPYYRSGQRLVIHARHGDAALTLEKMGGMNVGAQIGTTGAEMLQARFPRIKVRTFENVVTGFQDLDQGNLDGFVTDDPVARYYASMGQYRNLRFVDQEYTAEDYGFVVRRGDKELLDRLNEGLRKAKEKGLVEQIKDKWLR